jgi:RNA polymerase sigma-70 factor (ECF subfamily)
MGPVIELSAGVAGEQRLRPPSAAGSLARISDEQLMELVAVDHDQLAFGELYDRHVGVAFACAVRICRERALAEDAVQEAFLSLWRARARFDSRRGNVRSWVLTIARNRAIDLLRRSVNDRAELVEQALEDRLEALQRTDQEADRHEQTRTLRLALESLPAEQSLVIELAYYGGYTHSEIASMSGAAVGTIKGRMRLGLQKLRAELEADRAIA